MSKIKDKISIRESCDMKFPYGISDFQSIISENYFYIDRTDRIRLIEEAGKQLLFLRPRRFGKSLLLSMLDNYYNVAKADQFKALFGHLAIGQNPTSLHNQFFVMKWDFSAVDPQGSPEEIKNSLHRYINGRIQNFAVNYQNLLPLKIQIEPVDAFASFQSLLTAVQQTSYPLYLLIDEYDNFANELIMDETEPDNRRYKALLYGEGALKSIFKMIKSASSAGGLARVFMTGVSPIVLSDITSGYNIAENISLDQELNDLCGFWESEIETTLKEIAAECNFPDVEVTKALDMMRTFYNGYCFSYRKESLLYNPTLAIYFFKKFQKNCQYPDNMLDSNLAMDRGKIRYISQLPGGEEVIIRALNDDEPLSITVLADRFGVEDMLYMKKDETFMVSLLYYFGVLTLKGTTGVRKKILKIPNLVIEKLYVEQLQDMFIPDFNEARRVAELFYTRGDIKSLCEFMETRYFKVFDNRDYRWANELTVKTAFVIFLFNDLYYIMDSETAVDRKYIDLTLIVRPDMRSYELRDIVLEFKYVSLAEAGLPAEKAKNMSREELSTIPIVKQKLLASSIQLDLYRDSLEKKYSHQLQLNSYSIIAIGFERLLWKENKLA
jgi:hypothetical protein